MGIILTAIPDKTQQTKRLHYISFSALASTLELPQRKGYI
jgi:hypothetical protein